MGTTHTPLHSHTHANTPDAHEFSTRDSGPYTPLPQRACASTASEDAEVVDSWVHPGHGALAKTQRHLPPSCPQFEA